jgi:competence protein ComEA
MSDHGRFTSNISAVRAGVSEGHRKAALLILGLVITGGLVRLVARGPEPAGAVAFRAGPDDGRPVQDSVRALAQRLNRPLARGERIDVDVASAADLTRLPRVGSGLATRIVSDRETSGAFGSLSGLDRVSGVGPSLLETIRPHVTFSGRPADNARDEAHKVSLNRASEAELATLPGIGPARARAIVEDRSRNGNYRTLEELSRVRGIGEATLRRLEGLVEVP